MGQKASSNCLSSDSCSPCSPGFNQICANNQVPPDEDFLAACTFRPTAIVLNMQC